MKDIETKKVDARTIIVTKVIPASTMEIVYNYDFIIERRKLVKADLDRLTEKKSTELEELDEIIAKAKGIGMLSTAEEALAQGLVNDTPEG